MSDAYSAEALRERARSYAEMAQHAHAAEQKHRNATSTASTPLERYAAQALMQTSNCTARHWKKLADVLDLAATEIEEREAEMVRQLNPTVLK